MTCMTDILPGTGDGRLEVLKSRALPGESALFYEPPRILSEQLLVFVHGYGRRAEEQLEALRPLADLAGKRILAPLFSREEHPGYQRLARSRGGRRADDVLNALLDEFDPAGRAQPVVMIGYSGGAQFAHRFAMAHPRRVAQLLVVAAGWYTLPDPLAAYPLGLRPRRRSPRVLDPDQFLRIPATVLVGDGDTSALNLRRGEALDRSQGVTRVERARTWVAHMRVAAERHGLEPQVNYREVPGVGHCFFEFLRAGHLLPLLAMELGLDASVLAAPGANTGSQRRHARSEAAPPENPLTPFLKHIAEAGVDCTVEVSHG